MSVYFLFLNMEFLILDMRFMYLNKRSNKKKSSYFTDASQNGMLTIPHGILKF